MPRVSATIDTFLQEATASAATLTALEAMTVAQQVDSWEAIRDGADVQATADLVNSQRYVAAKIGAWTTGGGGVAPPVRLAYVGDSLSTFGGGLKPGPFMGNAGTIGLQSYNRTGSTTVESANFALWITGTAITYAVGSTGEYTKGGGASGDLRGDKACIGYIAGPGRGTFDLQYQTNGTGAWTTLASVNTSNASTIGVYTEYSLPTSNSPFYRLRVNNVTVGNVTITPVVGIYNSNGGGVIEMPQWGQLSGLDLSQMVQTPSAIFTPIWTGLAPDCVLSLFADTSTQWESGGDFRTFYASCIAAFPATDWIQISRNPSYEDNVTAWSSASVSYVLNQKVSQSPTGSPVVLYVCTSAHTSAALTEPGVGANWATVWAVSTPSTQVDTTSALDAITQAAAQRAWAIEERQTFINGLELFAGSWIEANEREMMGDVTHPNATGATARNQHMWSKLPLGSYFLGGFGRLAGNELEMNGSAISGAINSQPILWTRALESAISLRVRDSAALMDGSRVWFLNAASRALTIGNSGGTGLTVSLAIDGTAGVFPGFNNMALGSTSLRFDPVCRNFSSNGTTIRTPDTLSGAGAIPITTTTTAFTSTGAGNALTLANGTNGQVKTIVHDVDGGSGVLTPTTKTGFTTVTFNNAGDTVTLQYFTTHGWMVIGSFGAVIA